MKPKTMVLMFVAVGCGLVASYMTSKLIADRGQSAEPRIKVLVAKKKLKNLMALNKPEELFMEKELPQDAVPKKVVKSYDELKDKRLNKLLNEEAILTTDDLVGKDLIGMEGQLPPGTRAIALKVNAETLAGGFILPGTRVDVVNTTRDDGISQIILQDMLVLAVDMQNNRDTEKGGAAMMGSTVTLLATPEESTRLALATGLGELRLLLRGLNDNEKLQVRGSRRADLTKPIQKSSEQLGTEGAVAMGSGPKIPELPTPPSDPPANPMIEMNEPEPEQPKTHKLTIISGEAQATHTFFQEKDGSWRLGNQGKNEGDDPARQAKPRAAWPRPGVPAAEKKDEPKADQGEAKPLTLQERQQLLQQQLQQITGLPPVPVR